MSTKKMTVIGFSVILAIAAVSFGCSFFGETGSISLDITDAPIADAKDVEGVFITVTSIAYNLNGQWIEDSGFNGPKKFNLLELTGGTVEPLSDVVIPSGEVTQIRLMLDAAEEGAQGDGNSGCYITIDPDGTADGIDENDVDYTLFVPSGGQTGYKANGPFTVPVNGTVEITADFDVRKSVLYSGNESQGNGAYILKPTIRLIVNDQAGSIEGSFTGNALDSYEEYIVFVYEDGTYDPSEATPADDESAPFPNAVSSAAPIDTDEDAVLDSYTIPFLAAGTYDLVVVGVAEDGTYTVLDQTHVDVSVTEGSAATENIDLAPVP